MNNVVEEMKQLKWMNRNAGCAERCLSGVGRASWKPNCQGNKGATILLHPMNEIIREDNGEKLIGGSPAIQQVIQDIALLAPFDEVTVVLQGETGVGKDLVARLIHANSPRSAAPLVSVNGATIPDDLWEAECFGVKTGAFTGAQPRDGLFRPAQGGTLFLNELQDWPRRQHAQLKEFLQQRLIRRVGDDRPLKLDVRVIVASNVDLDQMVADGQMARDVCERLGHNRILIPPLRQRREDIPALVECTCLASRRVEVG